MVQFGKEQRVERETARRGGPGKGDDERTPDDARRGAREPGGRADLLRRQRAKALAEAGDVAPAVDSGTSFELPSVDAGTAAAIGGVAGATLIIGAAAFAARRQRVGPA